MVMRTVQCTFAMVEPPLVHVRSYGISVTGLPDSMFSFMPCKNRTVPPTFLWSQDVLLSCYISMHDALLPFTKGQVCTHLPTDGIAPVGKGTVFYPDQCLVIWQLALWSLKRNAEFP
jgi:hypothetical protein